MAAEQFGVITPGRVATPPTGLVLPNGQFESLADIQRKYAPPVEMSPVPQVTDRSLRDWTNLLTLYQDKRREILPIPKQIEITHRAQEPVFYALIGDTHAGGQDVDYARINDEVQQIKETHGTYVMAMGDLIDAFFFNPAQQEEIINTQEQVVYGQKVLEELKGHLVAGWGGDHDLWSQRDGPTMYQNFVKDYGAHYLEGLSYVTVNVGKSKFNIAGAHRFGGHSIYNAAHPEMRMQREAGDGGDIFIGAHTHHKAVNRQTLKGFGGAREALFISLGAYKSTDRYARKLGYPQMDPAEMGGVGMILYPDEKRVDVHWDIREGLKEFKRL